MILNFKGHPICIVSNIDISNSVYQGIYMVLTTMATRDGLDQAMEYIAFSTHWNSRVNIQADANPAEFNAFFDVIHTNSWTAKSPEHAKELQIEDAPVFFGGNEVSFRVLEF